MAIERHHEENQQQGDEDDDPMEEIAPNNVQMEADDEERGVTVSTEFAYLKSISIYFVLVIIFCMLLLLLTSFNYYFVK